jgi:hypothetical protein
MTDQPRETMDEEVEGHARPRGADAETAEGDEDTEGHSKKGPSADAETAEGDDNTEDTAGHQKRPNS